ncbi:MAG: DUF2304 family protein [Mycoplasmatales bacterium]
MKLLVFLALGVILVGLRMNYNIKKEKINFKFVYINYIVLILFLIVDLSLAFFPGFMEWLMNVTGISTPSNLVFLFVLAYLFYVSFLQQVQIAKQNEQIEKMARVISVEKSKTKWNK